MKIMTIIIIIIHIHYLDHHHHFHLELRNPSQQGTRIQWEAWIRLWENATRSQPTFDFYFDVYLFYLFLFIFYLCLFILLFIFWLSIGRAPPAHHKPLIFIVIFNLIFIIYIYLF